MLWATHADEHQARSELADALDERGDIVLRDEAMFDEGDRERRMSAPQRLGASRSHPRRCTDEDDRELLSRSLVTKQREKIRPVEVVR